MALARHNGAINLYHCHQQQQQHSRKYNDLGTPWVDIAKVTFGSVPFIRVPYSGRREGEKIMEKRTAQSQASSPWFLEISSEAPP